MTRAQLLRGNWGSDSQKIIRPPWSKAEELFVDICTRCGECISACPEKIIATGSGGFPVIDFSKGECIFCKKCAEVCQHNLFTTSDEKPWNIKADIKDNCLSKIGVVCQSCSDVCEQGVINFSLYIGGVPEIELSTDKCNGCGACVVVCPKDAIQIST